MVVSMLQIIFELPEVGSIKDKRRVVSAVKDRLRTKFRVSCAEVDLQDSLRFAHLGAAYVSNSRQLGEEIMNKALNFVEDGFSVRIHDVQIHSELY
ncbi:MAG TPA: DUF503 domain-containing protein [Rectinemataceae bacterium]|nr:DUF503 domain-containing protein [Rectinemataceae bacterium]